ncbi:MAG: DHA2 family efflux MFS transporter permease subunit, partial [Alphaproteobacteria bacterium]
LSWIQTAYLMAEVVAIPLSGWLTRALSLRWLFASATAMFGLASLGCALSGNAAALIGIRVVQGVAGGMLIPCVFTATIAMFPERSRVLATTIAGTFAVLAPTVGPTLGGYLTQYFSWHWIFLVNLAPAALVTVLVFGFVRIGRPDLSLFRALDYFGVVLAAIFLATLELLLKQGPSHNWTGTFVFSLFAICALTSASAAWRCFTQPHPFVDLRKFRDSTFAIGSALSFVFGAGLYGSVYLLALFLGLVRGHSALAIGEIMMVSGAAQLLTAPLAAYAETRFDPRWLTALGFAVFGAGLIANGFEHSDTDFWGQFAPQLLRGASVMFCLLPATRLALDQWPPDELADASGLFNLLRNLGGAIGLAVIDTILEQRAPVHAARLAERLQAGERAAALEVGGLPLDMFQGKPIGPIDDMTRTIIEPLVKRAALTESFNEAWLAVGAAFLVPLVLVLLMPRPKRG